LYALVFEHYKIPYEIKEQPTHVYIIADPKKSRIVVETTSPGGGYFLPDARYKKQFVDYLVRNKLVSQEEVNRSSTDEIFAQKYQTGGEINFVQLAALQYHNIGLLALDEEKAQEAYQAFQKSYKLYPSASSRYLLSLSLAQLVVGLSYDKLEDVELLLRFYVTHAGTDLNTELVSDFKQLTQKHLIERNDTALYRQVYSMFTATVKDKLVQEELMYIYNFHKGRSLLLQYKVLQAMPLLLEAYKVKPTSVEAQGLLTASLKHLLNDSNKKDALYLLDQLNEVRQTHPDLIKIPGVQEAFLYIYSGCAHECIYQNKFKEGNRFIALMEEEYNKADKNVFGPKNMGNFYLHLSRLCINKNKAAAKKFAHKGLTYDAHNIDLKTIATLPN
ncbi:MAG: hypothetical protein LPK19_05215, partial [Hymenobacteraceae bacterium]|nr:hypothetical protein [Hymenobacteraceae bacterium]MDX5395599.1 hypothetical protein [Hymenobacteraceae bacterium]MDX5511651.1 hypothetical protein [Hymenobacteraceae bacterium]